MATTHFHPYLTPAVQQQAQGLEMEVGFWTHNSSTWALVNLQFKSLVMVLTQGGQPLTPTLAANPPQAMVEFERLAIHPHSKLTVAQAVYRLGWAQAPMSSCCWWGKVAGGPSKGKLLRGQPGFVEGGPNIIWGNRYHGGLTPPMALRAYIDRKANSNLTMFPWWSCGQPYAHILDMQAVGRTQQP